MLQNNVQLILERQAVLCPDKIALTFEGTHISYSELNMLSNRVAHYLVSCGVEPGGLVPICLDRSFEMVIGIFGILKARCGYVPVDPSYPSDRIRFILEDASAKVAICQPSSRNNLAGNDNLLVAELNIHSDFLTAYSSENIEIGASPDDLAYVMYTLGSTGKPKGVITDQLAIMNRLTWCCDYFNITGADVFLQKTTFCFDVSLVELLGPVICGSRMVLARPGGHLDNNYLKHIVEKEGVTTCHFVPSMLTFFLDSIQPGDCSSLKRVFCSGEALKLHHAAAFKRQLPNASLYNLYGPTEAAVDVTCYDLADLPADAMAIPLGKPMDNVTIIIADDQLRPVPTGTIGELLIGGIAVAKGYLNRPELTATKFIQGASVGLGDMRFYRTGDWAKYTDDGNIEFFGRMDEQVKMAGIRIELLEIETVAESHSDVKAAVVVAKNTLAGLTRLVCYIKVNGVFDKAGMITFLLSKLPEYMVPTVWVALDDVPLNASGKVDRKALPEVADFMLEKDDHAAAETETEKALLQIWTKVLDNNYISIKEHFLEVGGNSLLAIKVMSDINRTLGTQVNVKHLYTYPTIRELALFIENNALSAKEISHKAKKASSIFQLFRR